MCDEAGIFNCTSLAIGFIYVWLCSPQASNNNNNNNKILKVTQVCKSIQFQNCRYICH